MKLDNGILCLELTNKGGEMSSLKYKDYDVLYKGDGEYWSGKNPTLFPMISSPDKKEYTYEGKTYPCRNHGLIRYLDLETIEDNNSQITMRLLSNSETLKEYPFNFEYKISYKLNNKKVLINYEIKNNDNKIMPFTFGLHPGFIVSDLQNVEIEFPNDDRGTMFNQLDRTDLDVELGVYRNFINDIDKYKTIIFKNLKSKYVVLKMKEYSVKVDMSKFKYLALWSPNPKSGFICIEPWLSINDIKNASNAFDSNFELEYLKPNEVFKIDYSIELL